MKNIIWASLLIILGLGLYFVFGYPNPVLPSISPTISAQNSTPNLDETKSLDSKNETVSKEDHSSILKVTTVNQNNNDTDDETASIDEQLKELQKLTTMDLSKIEEGLKYALLNGSAEITPEGNISFGMDSTYVSDMQAHRSMGIGISTEDYYAQDTNISQWARDTENQISAALSNPEFIKEFSDLVVYDFSCKDTMCRISFSGRIVVSSNMVEHFTYIPTLGTHFGGRSSSMGIDADGNTHVFISRNMIKEPEY